MNITIKCIKFKIHKRLFILSNYVVTSGLVNITLNDRLYNRTPHN